jgi:UDP-N-acetyl-D-galactosamine dehydrogenase
MGAYVASEIVKLMNVRGMKVAGARVLVLGLTFKENCPDLRNSKVVDIIAELQDYGIRVQVADPLADPAEAMHEYGVELVPFAELEPADALVVAVAHREYRDLPVEALRSLMNGAPVLVDVKGIYDRGAVEAAGMQFWRL